LRAAGATPAIVDFFDRDAVGLGKATYHFRRRRSSPPLWGRGVFHRAEPTYRNGLLKCGEPARP
jgi:hypothetical protein